MTPDKDLSARLAELRSLSDDSGDAQTAFIRGLSSAYRSGQLITLADHQRTVQDAVAKAVEAERAECITIADDHMISHMPLVCDEDEWRADEAVKIAAAIRARKGDAP